MRYDMKYKKLNVEDNESCNLQCEKKCEKLAGVFLCCILAFFLLFLSTRNVGLIYQFYNLIPILNVEENITLPLSLDNREVNKNKLDELINTLGLQNRRTHLPNELSGGQQQRTSIGRAMITNPAIILADEPTGNLDSKSSDEIVELLRKSNRDYKQTIIMITHNMEIAKSADRIIKIEDGKIVGEV